MTKSVFHHIREYVLITVGLFMFVLGWTAFLIPSGIVGGGVSGIGTIIYFATGKLIPVAYTYLALNVVLLLLALKILGAGFGIKTVYAIIMASFLFGVLQKYFTEPLLPGEGFLSAVIGGMLAGAGIGITFIQGGSTGGTDIIAMIINKYRNVSPGRIILYIDLFIIGSSYLVVESFKSIAFGYVTMAVTAYTIDLIISGSKQSLQIFIISKKFNVIADEITRKMRRGVTVIEGKGWYSKENQQILMVLVRKHEMTDIYRLIKQNDPEAFISVASVMGVYGLGFDQIKA